MTLQEFEKKIGKNVKDLTIDDITKLTEDSEFLVALNEDTNFSIELANKIIDENENDVVKSEFIPIKYHYELYNSQITLSQMFAHFNDDKDVVKLVKNLDDYTKGATPLGKMNAYLVILTAFEDYNLSEHEDDVKQTVKDVEDTLINKIDPKVAFPIACEIVDSLFNIQQNYFERYQVDVIGEDAEKLNEYVSKLQEVAQPMYDAMNNELDEYVPEDATPEDIGLLDVTKLKEKGEED